MRRRVSLAFCMALLVTGMCPAEVSVVLVNDVDWPPYFLHDQEKSGFARELLGFFFRTKGLEASFEELPPSRTDLYMKDGRLDMCVYSYKPERESFLHYGKEPLFFVDYCIVYRADSETRFSSFKDLASRSVGRVRALAYTPEISGFLDGKERDQVSVVDSVETLLKMLSARRIDGFFDNSDSVRWTAMKLGMMDEIAFSGPLQAAKPYFLTVSRFSRNIGDGAGFLLGFDAWLRDFRKTGHWKLLVRKYGMPA